MVRCEYRARHKSSERAVSYIQDQRLEAGSSLRIVCLLPTLDLPPVQRAE
jgi:hypothetical protein